MSKTLKVVIAVVLMLFFTASCTKPEVQGNEGDNSGYNVAVVPYNGGADNDSVTQVFVDLGLPSGTLWAICNLGADSPEDIGDYFSWGETKPKRVYSWSNYRYGDVVDDHFKMTKYCTDSCYGLNGFVDNITVLERVDDAAKVNLGAAWHMPTREEWTELFQKTTCIWTVQNGVGGRLLTGWNGNSIFLPAAGFRLEEELVAPHSGMYWSSTLHSDFPERGYSFHFDSVNCHVCGTYERNRGQVVRAVRFSSSQK